MAQGGRKWLEFPPTSRGPVTFFRGFPQNGGKIGFCFYRGREKVTFGNILCRSRFSCYFAGRAGNAGVNLRDWGVNLRDLRLPQNSAKSGNFAGIFGKWPISAPRYFPLFWLNSGNFAGILASIALKQKLPKVPQKWHFHAYLESQKLLPRLPDVRARCARTARVEIRREYSFFTPFFGTFSDNTAIHFFAPRNYQNYAKPEDISAQRNGARFFNSHVFEIQLAIFTNRQSQIGPEMYGLRTFSFSETKILVPPFGYVHTYVRKAN